MSDGPATAELLAAAKDAAARDTDYYALLDLAAPDHAVDAPSLTRDAVQRAWRKRSLRYHPDKAGAAFDAAKWEEFGLARDVLASDEARAAYDAARAARLHKQRERDLMNAKQRRFAEELERAEANVAAGSGSTTTRTRGAGTDEQGGGGAKQQKNAEEEREKERQAAEGRRYMEERKRKLREAEERDQARARKEDEERDDRIRALEDQIAEKAKRRAEKRAKREARKSGVGEEEGSHKTKTATTTPTTTTTTSLPVPPPEPNPVTKAPPPPGPAVVDTPMSDDPIQFWETQWPKTKARLLAAQATKEKRLQQETARATTA